MLVYRVTLPHACYSIDVERGTIVAAAPIAKWAVGKSLFVFEAWVAGRRGTVEQVSRRADDGD